jgi:hypothetical protein
MEKRYARTFCFLRAKLLFEQKDAKGAEGGSFFASFAIFCEIQVVGRELLWDPVRVSIL